MVVVGDNETVVIGGLISDDYEDTRPRSRGSATSRSSGWLFKTTRTARSRSTNLLVFLTPHIVRNEEPSSRKETIRKREEFWERSQREPCEALGQGEEGGRRAPRRGGRGGRDLDIENRTRAGTRCAASSSRSTADRYPVDRMREIERREEADAREREKSRARASLTRPSYGVLAATFGDEGAAAASAPGARSTPATTALLVTGEDRIRYGVYEVRIGPFDDRR